MRPAGETNVVAVRADNSKPASNTWYSGGGIYRHVWLLLSGDVHIARHGTSVTTPQISAEQAQVKVRTEVTNGFTEDESVTLVSELLDADAKVVGTAQTTATVKARETYAFQ